MPLIPIGTEFRPRQPAYANWAIIGLNVLVFVFTDFFGADAGQRLKALYSLDAARPQLHQYLTYQFLHGDTWHLLGNMLFLWIFGHPVCDRMGTLGYTFFYLTGGVFSGVAYTLGSQTPMVGASGAIAAVTTAFLALFPRVHVTMLVWLFFVFTFQVPAMILIVFKMVLWDNIIAPTWQHGVAANVAYSAHLGGYAFGFATSMLLLAIHALPRNQFDLIALWDRWRRRNLDFGLAPARPVGPRPIVAEELDSRPLEAVPLTPVEQLREQIAVQLAEHDPAAAAASYLRLLALDPQQVLGRSQQIEIANYLAQTRRHSEAAQAYEAFLQAYPGAPELPQVQLFLGLIYSRYLRQYDRAVAHLRRALDALQLDAQRTLAEEELRHAEARLTGG